MTQPNNEWQPATTCEGLQRDNILQEILDNIDSYVHGFEGINLAPLKHDVLKKVLEGEFNPEIQIRGLLKTFHHTHEFKAALDQIHSGDLKNKITKFIEGDTKVFSNVPFENWGQTVQNTPRYTFLPTTVVGVQNVVDFASKNGYRVRCAGYRHSWSSTFAQDNEIFVSFVDLETVTTLPDPLSIESAPYDGLSRNEFKRIELKEETSKSKRLCRVGVAVTNEEFRRWAFCHGAGIGHKTLSDYVRRIEYVDCNAKLQVVDDPVQIKAAAGCFGLLGVVTHITYELDAMSYAILEPKKVDIGLAIPPPTKYDIPVALRQAWFGAEDATERLIKAKEAFEDQAANRYYSEWFWFTYQEKAWVNTWDTKLDATDVVNYPNDGDVFLQWVENWLGGVVSTHPLFQALPGYWQAQLMATSGMSVLPPTLGEDNTKKIKTALPNALHFRRGIQNMRVRDMEFEIPLQPRKDDPTKPDFSTVQRAWWDVIKLVYSDKTNSDDPSSPMWLTMELRITGGSDMLMAPQKGNEFGTASIEILTIPDAVPDGEWQEFCEKEWDRMQLKGVDAREYLKHTAYEDQIPEFRRVLGEIGQTQDWSLEDLKKRFSNELWDKMIYE
ncbi:hypothetical protein BDV97DRAFT_407622 [Delphinella strobiligena]|nr:hypothetical protein BDV97DRAFT_407622 [Delphinella strobiligena]